MSEHRLDSGRDTHAASDNAQATPHQSKKVRLVGGGPNSQGYLQFTKMQKLVLGKSVKVARIGCRPVDAMNPQTITVVQPRRYDVAKLKWANRPENFPGQVQVNVPAVNADERFWLPVAELVQKVADGQPDYGFRLATSATFNKLFWSFNAERTGWVLELTLAPPSDAPTDLAPASGEIGTPRPVLRWRTGEQQDEFQVEVTTGGVTFATGTVASTITSCNLSDTSFAGAVANQSTTWRVRTRASGEDWSDWSDVHAFTYVPQPTLAFNSPLDDTLYDASPLVGFTSTVPLVKYQTLVKSLSGETLYESTATTIPAASEVLDQIPLKVDKRQFMEFDNSYDLVARGWTSGDRRQTPGFPEYAQVTKRVTLKHSTEAPPVAVSVDEVIRNGPGLSVRLARNSLPDAWVVERSVRLGDGWLPWVTVLNVAPTEDEAPARVSPGVYQWQDNTSPMSSPVRYRVSTVTDKVTSRPSSPVQVEPDLHGVWIVRENGEAFVLENDSVDLSLMERRTTLSPRGSRHDIHRVSALGGSVGGVEGTVDANSPIPVATALPIIKALRGSPEEIVRLVHRSVNIPVILIEVDYQPASEGWTAHRQLHDVSFAVEQVDEFDSDLGD